MKYTFAIIGDPVAHSRSPELYAPMFEAAGIDAEFLRIKVSKDELPSLRHIVQANKLCGFAVTMPHKRAIMQYLDDIDHVARNAGSVNIVTIENGALIGHNTDGDGLVNALRESGLDVCGKRIIILGNGGASAGAREAIERNGGMVSVITRSANKSLIDSINDAEQNNRTLSSADVLINATPLGMKNNIDFADLDFINLLQNNAVVADMVYRDGGTTLLNAAKARGLIAFGGERMLCHQGLLAFKLWTGLTVSDDSIFDCNTDFYDTLVSIL